MLRTRHASSFAPPQASAASDRRAETDAGAAATALSRTGTEPLYRQLAERLRTQIDAGLLAQGERIGSEPQLMAEYDVSRVTVRQAIALLRDQGRVVAHRGKGTFVSSPPVHHDLDALQGFYDVLRGQGLDPVTRLIEYSAGAGAGYETLPPGLDLPVRLQRLYELDGRPFALVVGFLPAAAASLGADEAGRLMIYDILRDRLGERVAHAEVTIRCQRVPREVGRRLGLATGQPALVMERISRTASNAPCEFTRIHIVPERYEFRLRVAGELELARAVHRAPVAEAASPPPEE